MKATEQYFPVVLFIIYALQGGSNFFTFQIAAGERSVLQLTTTTDGSQKS